ncbi:MAG: methyltransferase domain-containing protein [Bdellovibrionales bacterium]|nr:methyltransferase domain-containing protein [Bdellovibrionales bacterium]
MKIHRPIYVAIENALARIFIENQHAEKIVDYYLKNEKKWGARDRRLFAEVVYDIVRYWRTYFAVLEFEFNSTPVDKAIIARVIESYLTWRERPGDFLKITSSLSRAERESVPDWLDEWGEEHYAEQWGTLLHALNKPARQYLRANELRCDIQSLQKKLAFEQIETEFVPNVPTALALKERKNVFKTEAYKSGFFEMQDGGSQLIAPFLKAEPGDRVIDACAGGGGKTLHLAAQMKNKGQIIALDVHEWKLNELKTRAKRAGVSIVETRVIESNKVIKRLSESADRVLLDVPCSGLGVLRRHPDTKWKLSLAEIKNLETLQQDILQRYSSMVKAGGTLVYATCSIAPSENEQQVQNFIARNEGRFQLEEELHIWPTQLDSDGFYAARIKKLTI